MDITALSFYAVVCGALSVAAPNLGRPAVRFALGALVGILAAAVLPVLKGFISY